MSTRRSWRIPKNSNLAQSKVCTKRERSLCCFADAESGLCISCNKSCKSGIALQALSNCCKATVIVIGQERICFACKKPCKAQAISNL